MEGRGGRKRERRWEKKGKEAKNVVDRLLVYVGGGCESGGEEVVGRRVIMDAVKR